MTNQIIFRGCIGLAMSTALLAQATRGSAPVAGPTTPTVGRTPTNTQPNVNQPNNTIPDIQRPIYISGKVVLNDGTPPSEPVTMQLVCSGSPRAVGFTDSKGRFSIDLGQRNNSAVFADASQSGFGRFGDTTQSSQPSRTTNSASSGITERAFMGCDLQAYLPGFRSDQVSLSNRHSLDNPEVGTVVLHRLGNVEGFTISATSALAPKDAKKAFEKGRGEAKKAKWENAEKEFQKAVDAYPQYAAAWYELGLAQQQQKNIEGARKSYAQALAADSKLVSPYQQLALLSAKENKWEDVVSTTDRLLHLNPVDFPQDWFLSALANYKLHKLDAAEKSATSGLGADSMHQVPRLHQVMAMVLADKQDYSGASEQLKMYLKLVPQAPDAEQVKKQLAEVEKFTKPQAAAKTPEVSRP